jgi:hypothetical protein
MTLTLPPKTERRLDTRWKNAKLPWTQDELDVLSSKWGLISDKAMAKLLQRSPHACRVAAVRLLHQSRSLNFLTASDVAKLLGFGCSKTVVWWVQQGWLMGRQCSVGAGVNKRWMFKEKNVEKCLRARPWLCSLNRMEPSYYRSIIQEEYDKDPWYTLDQAAPMLGVKTTDAVNRYIRKALPPAVKRPGGSHQGTWLVRRSAIQLFLANDPRPSVSALMSASRLKTHLSQGRPVRLALHWSVLCPDCRQRVIVMAHPKLQGPAVQAEFNRTYTNGHCKHGIKCTVGILEASA